MKSPCKFILSLSLLMILSCYFSFAQNIKITFDPAAEGYFMNIPGDKLYMVAIPNFSSSSVNYGSPVGQYLTDNGIGIFNYNNITFSKTINLQDYFHTTQAIYSISISFYIVGINNTGIFFSGSSTDTAYIQGLQNISPFTSEPSVTVSLTHHPLLQYTFKNTLQIGYFHSSAEQPTGNWVGVVGNWGTDDGVGQFMRTSGNDSLQITIDPFDYYNNFLSSSKIGFRLRDLSTNVLGIKANLNDSMMINFLDCPFTSDAPNSTVKLINDPGSSAITPNFSESIQNGEPLNDTIALINQTVGTTDYLAWTIHDGDYNLSSFSASPSNLVFSSLGCKNITLTTLNGAGCFIKQKNCAVEINDKGRTMSANFTSDKFIATTGETIKFKDLTTGAPSSRTWLFNGGIAYPSDQVHLFIAESKVYNRLGKI